MADRDELLLRPKWLDEWDGIYSLIEPSIGSTAGVPDAHLIGQGFLPGWVEFKALDEKREFKLRPAQRRWMLDHLPFTRRIAVVLLEEEGCWTFPASLLVDGPPRSFELEEGLSTLSPFLPWGCVDGASIRAELERCYV